MRKFYIDNGFGGKDEKAMQEQFEELCGGVKRAERLMWIWNNSYQIGTKYDQVFKTGFHHTKRQVFDLKAKKEGFTDEQIQCFLEL